MRLIYLIFSIFGIFVAGFHSEPVKDSRIGKSSVTTKKLVERHNYPFETHTVRTRDNYLLALHRIPYSSKNDSAVDRPVVLLQHGLLCTSSDWILTGPNDALGYILSDAGYDVWLGNSRGNTYSKKHKRKWTWQPSFWDFTWHEVGTEDVPAMIEYILKVTKKKQLHYIGHSQGTTAFFVMGSLKKKIQSLIKSAHLLAPVALMGNMKSPFAKKLAPLLGRPYALRELIGAGELLPSNKLSEMLGAAVCREQGVMPELCSNAYFRIAGCNPDNLNTTMFPDYFATYPGGGSTFQPMHYLQLQRSDKFQFYDYGWMMNKVKYNQIHPPKYKVKNIKVDMYLYYADKDLFTDKVDVARIKDQLVPEYVKTFHLVEDLNFTHPDFLYGINAKDVVHKYIIEDLKKYN